MRITTPSLLRQSFHFSSNAKLVLRRIQVCIRSTSSCIVANDKQCPKRVFNYWVLAEVKQHLLGLYSVSSNSKNGKPNQRAGLDYEKTRS